MNEVELNGTKLTEAQFAEVKEKIEEKKDAKVVEVAEGVFKTRLHD